MPPIMGAAAYMMLEIVEPAVTYLEIIRAALLPAILYYTGMLCMVHFAANAAKDRHAQSSEEAGTDEQEEKNDKLLTVPGGIFLAAFVTLIVFLLLGATAFRAVSWSLLVIVVISLLNFLVQRIGKQRTTAETASIISDVRKGADFLITPCGRAAQSGVSLIAAAACVGIILGVVTLTGVGSQLPSTLLPLAATNLMLALFS